MIKQETHLSKGIKMEYAKKKNSRNQDFHVSELDKSDNGNLICKYCEVDIQYVSAHVRNTSKKPIAAYLKLRQNCEHDDNCGYSVKGAVELLVAESDSLEDKKSIFELQGDGGYLFRMNMLVDAYATAQSGVQSDEVFSDRNDLTIRKNYIRSEKHLASYFRSAAGIAKLRALIQDSKDIDELKRLIKIQYKDKFISWNDFYYDETRYNILFNRILKKCIPHPVALNITLKGEAKYFKDAKYFHWSFQCYSQIVTNDGKKQIFVPSLQLAEEVFAKRISTNDTLLVIGNVWGQEPKKESNMFRNFNIGIFHQSQLKKEIE